MTKVTSSLKACLMKASKVLHRATVNRVTPHQTQEDETGPFPTLQDCGFNSHQALLVRAKNSRITIKLKFKGAKRRVFRFRTLTLSHIPTLRSRLFRLVKPMM